jgi:hypothetical protein
MFDLIVIGGGASGLFSAVNAAAKAVDVLVLEKSAKLLAKVKISGGGRCNVTHHCLEVPNLIKNYPRGFDTLKIVFKQFQPKDTIQWFESKGVSLKTEADGRMFPVSNVSQTIIDCLLKEATQHGVKIEMGVLVESITYEKEVYTVTYLGGTYQSKQLLIATGGNLRGPIRDFLIKTNHSFIAEVPSLFTFNMPNHPILKLMGLVVEKVKVKTNLSSYFATGPLLITHWGMSGPAVLKLSAWAAREINEQHHQFKITVNWLGDHDDQTFKQWFQSFRSSQGSKKMSSKNPFDLPNRLWDYLLEILQFGEALNWADMNKEQLKKLMTVLLNHEFEINGKTTYKEEFVTSGGIAIDSISLKTMESKFVPHLYFAGEVLNIDGVTGGFNFQFAWSSGWIAAQQVHKTLFPI